jgi:hypothetical protein
MNGDQPVIAPQGRDHRYTDEEHRQEHDRHQPVKDAR